MKIDRDLIDGYLRYATGESIASVCESCRKSIPAGSRLTFFTEGPPGVFCSRKCRYQAVTPEAVEAAIEGRIARCEDRIADEQMMVALYKQDLARVRVPELFSA